MPTGCRGTKKKTQTKKERGSSVGGAVNPQGRAQWFYGLRSVLVYFSVPPFWEHLYADLCMGARRNSLLASAPTLFMHRTALPHLPHECSLKRRLPCSQWQPLQERSKRKHCAVTGQQRHQHVRLISGMVIPSILGMVIPSILKKKRIMNTHTSDLKTHRGHTRILFFTLNHTNYAYPSAWSSPKKTSSPPKKKEKTELAQLTFHLRHKENENEKMRMATADVNLAALNDHSNIRPRSHSPRCSLARNSRERERERKTHRERERETRTR